jgi:NAD-dependent deacetylase
VKPNAAHFILAELEDHFEVQIITQNVDDLHERAGSTKVLHLHGELLKSSKHRESNYIIDWSEDLHSGDFDENQNQLRPHCMVW